MKRKVFHFVFILQIICCVQGLPLISANAQVTNEGLMVEGVGLGNIVVGKSTFDDFVGEYGSDYEVIDHAKYSFEYSYKKKGLSFYICQADPNKEIFVVVAKPPFRARTQKGIILGKSTKSDVLRLYDGDNEGFELFYDDKDVVNEIDIIEKEGVRQCDSKFGVVKDK